MPISFFSIRACLPVSLTAFLALGACAPHGDAPLGSHIDSGQFGTATEANISHQTGELTYRVELGRRFAEEVPTTINFAFNSATLDADAQATLRQQAAFIRHFPEVRFTVYGHTDLVGPDAYNHQLGLRRAQAALNFLVAQGVERQRLDALVSLGETQPVVANTGEDRRNRRTVTAVTGFVETHPMVLDGQYARITYRGYVSGGH